MQSAGDDGVRVKALTNVAMIVLRGAAKNPDEVVGSLREQQLYEAMRLALHSSNSMEIAERDEGRRLGASAALWLIMNSKDMFTSHPVYPNPVKHLRGLGYVYGSASQLAQQIANDYAPADQPVPDNWAAGERLIEAVMSIKNGPGPDSAGGWEPAFLRLTTALHAFHIPEHELANGPWDELDGLLADGDRAEAGGDDGSDASGYQVPDVDPLVEGAEGTLRHDDSPRRDESDVSLLRADGHRGGRQWLIRPEVVAVTSVVVTVAVLCGLAFLFPAIPQTLDREQSDQAARTDEPLVDRYPIPNHPSGIDERQSPIALPHTTVQLFFMSDGSNLVEQDQTSNGLLPVVDAAVMPAEYQVVTFQIRLSMKSDIADESLRLWIHVPSPMAVEGATLMVDPEHEGEEQPKLNSPTDGTGNGGEAVEVPDLQQGPVVYQFQVTARPSETNNGYGCGYNAKFVEVFVQSAAHGGGSGAPAPDSREAVVIPYPLYVPRGEGC